MKSVLAVALLASLAMVHGIEYMTTENDYFDIDAMMASGNIETQYIKCFMDEGPCNSLGQSYKNNIVEAVSTDCHRCNDAQKHLWHRFLYNLKKVFPDQYVAFTNKYDPDHKYFESFEKVVFQY